MELDYTFLKKYENASVLRSFLQQCLNRDPIKRTSAEELLDHVWFNRES